MRARRQALRERERACVRERGGTEAAARLCAAEVHGCARRRSVHGWHALESCGLLSLVRLESRRRKRTPVDFAPGVTAFELTLPRRGGSQLTVTSSSPTTKTDPRAGLSLDFGRRHARTGTARHSPLHTRSHAVPHARAQPPGDRTPPHAKFPCLLSSLPDGFTARNPRVPRRSYLSPPNRVTGLGLHPDKRNLRWLSVVTNNNVILYHRFISNIHPTSNMLDKYGYSQNYAKK